MRLPCWLSSLKNLDHVEQLGTYWTKLNICYWIFYSAAFLSRTLADGDFCLLWIPCSSTINKSQSQIICNFLFVWAFWNLGKLIMWRWYTGWPSTTSSVHRIYFLTLYTELPGHSEWSPILPPKVQGHIQKKFRNYLLQVQLFTRLIIPTAGSVTKVSHGS